VALRKELRKNGHDVSLGSMDIVCRGFKNETAVREGYKESSSPWVGERRSISRGRETISSCGRSSSGEPGSGSK
jgi:hypothetical protein